VVYFYFGVDTVLLVNAASWPSYDIPGGPLEFITELGIVYLVALAGTLGFAFPVFIVLTRVNMVRWWTAISTGAILGFLFNLLIGDSWHSPWLRGHLGVPAIGAVCGLIFWVIAGRNTQPNNRLEQRVAAPMKE
jgi:hypothetical protein